MIYFIGQGQNKTFGHARFVKYKSPINFSICWFSRVRYARMNGLYLNSVFNYIV